MRRNLRLDCPLLPVPLHGPTTYLDNFFSTEFRYLGPLRDEPKSLYPLSPTSDPSDVGLKGEHTAAVLELYKNRQIQYIPPAAFSDAEINPQPITRSLETAVVDWLQYLGVAEDVKSEDKGKFGHELTVRITGTKRPHDLTHVGRRRKPGPTYPDCQPAFETGHDVGFRAA